MDYTIEGTEDQPEETRISICNVLQQVMISQDFNHIRLTAEQAKELRELLERVR